MRVIIRRSAFADLKQISEWIARDNPPASHDVVRRIRSTIAVLADYPEIGKKGRQPDTREVFVPRLPYVVVYKVRPGSVELFVVGIFHTARARRRRV